MKRELEILKRILIEADEEETQETPETPEEQPKPEAPKNKAFEEDPMGFILKKYASLNDIMTELMTKDFKEYLSRWAHNEYDREITFSVSAKLPVSGEPWKDAIKPEVVKSYQDVGYVYLKFVITNDEDLKDAERAVEEYQKAGVYCPVYLMPVGGVESVYALNNRNVADLAMRKGWRYSDRLQVPLFKNEWGT